MTVSCLHLRRQAVCPAVSSRTSRYRQQAQRRHRVEQLHPCITSTIQWGGWGLTKQEEPCGGAPGVTARSLDPHCLARAPAPPFPSYVTLGELPNFCASVSLAVKWGWHCGPFQKCHEDQMRTEKCSEQYLRVSTTWALVIVFQIQENLPIVDYSAWGRLDSSLQASWFHQQDHWHLGVRSSLREFCSEFSCWLDHALIPFLIQVCPSWI